MTNRPDPLPWLLSGDAGAALEGADQAWPLATAGNASPLDVGSLPADPAPTGIIFIDSRVPDLADLLSGVKPGELVYILNPDGDGLDQIAAILAANDYRDLSSISIVAHGADSELELGSSLVTDANLPSYANAIGEIGAALAPDGDIQLYGCDVAQGASGQQFIDDFAALAGGATVAAATHLVGDAADGGSWTLDASTGAPVTPESEPFTATAETAYQGVLSLTADQIVFTTWNGQVGYDDAGNRVEQFGVSGSTEVADSTIDLADGSQSDDSGVNYLTSGVAVDTARDEYFVAADNPLTYTLTIQRGSLSSGGLSTFYTIPFQDATDPNVTPSTTFAILGGLALDAQNNELYFAQDAENADTGDTVAADTGIYKISLSGGTPTVVTSTSAGLTNPAYLALDTAANLLFFDDAIVADGGFPAVNNLDVVNLSTGTVTVLKSFSSPSSYFLLNGMAIDTANNTLYLTTADLSAPSNSDNAILSIPFTVSGSGSSATASIGTITTLYSGAGADQPTDIVIDPANDIFYTTGEESYTVSGSTGDAATVFEGSLGGGTSLTPVLSMADVTPATTSGSPALDTADPQLVLLLQPIVTAGSTVTAAKGGSAVTIDPDATVSDPDGQLLVSATITGAQTGDTLSFNGGNSFTFGDGDAIIGSFSGGTLTLTGDATAADYQSAFDAVTFATSSTDAVSRTIAWTVNDGIIASTAADSTVQIYIGAVVTASGTVTFHGGGSAVPLDAGLTISAGSSPTLVRATVTIAAGFISGDTLNFTSQNGITEAGYADGTLTLSGTASVADYQSALDSISYNFSPVSGDPTSGGSDMSRVIDWTVNDGTSASTPASTTLDVVHTAPTVTAGGNATFDGDGAARVLDGGITVSDADSNGMLAGATVAIGSGFITGDTLEISATTTGTFEGINYQFTGSALSLTGSAAVSSYQSALAAVEYTFTSGGDPTGGGSHTSRTIDWTVNDGSTQSGTSTVASSTLTTVHEPPTLSNVPESLSAVAGAPDILAVSALAADIDSSDELAGATITITSGGVAGDVLGAVTSGTSITATYHPTSDTLTLTGSDTLAHYNTVLASVELTTSAAGTRTLSWIVEDGNTQNGSSSAQTETLTVTNVVSWTAAGGDWDTATNWLDDTVPNVADEAIIATSGTVTVTHSGGTAEDVGSLLIGTGDTVSLTSGSLTVGSALTNSGALDIGGSDITSMMTVSAASLVNSGGITIAGGAASADLSIAGTVSDTGSITLTGSALLSAGGGIGVSSGSSLTVSSGGTVSGNIVATNATMTDLGTIVGTAGIVLSSGGLLTVGSAAFTGGLVEGTTGVQALGTGAATIVNYGAISSTAGTTGVAVSLAGATGILVLEGSGKLVGSALGGGGTLELAAAGGIGTLTGLGTSFTNFADVTVDTTAQWVLSGNNTIASGVTLSNSGTLTNAGTLSGTGILFVGPGSMVNSGLVATYVTLGSGGYLDNTVTGTITADGIAVSGTAGPGTVSNTGTISGGIEGVFLSAGGTVINAGTISGGTDAVIFGGTGGNNLLVLEPGYAISGGVLANGSGNVLELLGTPGNTVTANYNGLGLSNFQDVLFGSGGSATLDVTNTSGSVAPTLSGFTLASDILDLTAIGTNGTISNIDTVNNSVTIAGSLGSVALSFEAGPDLADLITMSDGGTGTDVRLLPPLEDFYGSGTSDVLWQNGDSELDLWTMQNGQHISDTVLEYPGVTTGWQIESTGDFYGNGTSDVLWQNSDGEVDLWTMQNGQHLSDTVLEYPGVTTGWQVVGTGDFYGNGTSDVLWQNSDGELDMWTMQNGQHLSDTVLEYPGVTTGWQVVGTGDFYGNGTSDVLWQNTNGELDMWTMQNGQHISDTVLAYPGVTTGWQIVGTGNFYGNGNGTDDILWQNSDGAVDMWTMQSGQHISDTILASAGTTTGWQFVGTGDFYGNGADDILWRNTANGAVDMWTMQNGQHISDTILGYVPSTWQTK